MFLIDQETYVKHYGVKGMRWGVRKDRRAQRKAIKKERRSLQNKFEDEELKTNGFAKAEKEYYNIVEKHGFDGDDAGGAGKGKRGQEKARDRASKLLESLSDLEFLAIDTAHNRTIDTLVEKYGIDKLNELNINTTKKILKDQYENNPFRV